MTKKTGFLDKVLDWLRGYSKKEEPEAGEASNFETLVDKRVQELDLKSYHAGEYEDNARNVFKEFRDHVVKAMVEQDKILVEFHKTVGSDGMVNTIYLNSRGKLHRSIQMHNFQAGWFYEEATVDNLQQIYKDCQRKPTSFFVVYKRGMDCLRNVVQDYKLNIKF